MRAPAVVDAPRIPGPKSKRRPLTDCRACYCPANVLIPSCGHWYCRSCVAELFRRAIKDEAEFPAYCCRGEKLEIAMVRKVLDANLIKQYESKEFEYKTPGKDRVYCCAPTCSEFIHPSLIKDDIATCSECRSRTCIHCKGQAHSGECPPDYALKQLLLLAEKNGWQRCYFCNRVVELEDGCAHISCRCGADFCYKCGGSLDLGESSEECKCYELDVDGREDPAPDDLDIDYRALGVFNIDDTSTSTVELQDSAGFAEGGQDEDECNHEEFRFVQGYFSCELCSDPGYRFCYECRECGILACRRCRRDYLCVR
ncbi:BRcat and Rcat domain-containing protein [Aspergillus mulundensis]|uniref:RBR-type E3 ubiquitin transferase n=1 Tax=Aspergillus mulundensis TaxID=1810919 RepID=A0A3D8SJF7_9EURO|nr:hypothetical protein DSM5745_03102 [Aspergillus mulundensis]RDW86460.1 hypothetical protein DSM5745_03102 [Aspergillus mulundensis]